MPIHWITRNPDQFCVYWGRYGLYSEFSSPIDSWKDSGIEIGYQVNFGRQMDARTLLLSSSHSVLGTDQGYPLRRANRINTSSSSGVNRRGPAFCSKPDELTDGEARAGPLD